MAPKDRAEMIMLLARGIAYEDGADFDKAPADKAASIRAGGRVDGNIWLYQNQCDYIYLAEGGVEKLEKAGVRFVPVRPTKEMSARASIRKWAHRSINNTYADLLESSPYKETK